MKLRLWSDIHNEFGVLDWNRRDDDKETTLVIAGDFTVGNRHFDLLLELCNAFKYVLYTCGNHEYYHHNLESVDRKFAAFAADCPNFFFMNPDTVVLDGVRFVGATLWTDMNKGDPVVVNACRGAMNDYRQIKIGEKFSEDHNEHRVVDLQPRHTMVLNAKHVDFISTVLRTPFAGKTVVFTHHAPLMLCVGNDPRYKNARDSVMNYAYGNTTLDYLFEETEFVYWLHGHVHMWQEHEVNGHKVMARPRGYHLYEDCASNYKLNKLDAEVFEV